MGQISSFVIRISSFFFMTLAVKVAPNARRSEVTGWGADEQGRRVLLVKLAAPAHDGKANKELIRFMAEYLACAKSAISLLRGDSSRTKVLQVPPEAAARLK
jgi:uncharacterized protein (TIGR00251 family)